MSERINGYVDYGFHAVIKFGGSLLIDPLLVSSAVSGLELCAAHGKRVLVIPGGGPTDKAIEAIDKLFPFAPETHHQACARAQDQTGLMICDPVFSKKLRACTSLAGARLEADAGNVPILLPSQIIFDIDPFEKTWDITSDGMAVWFAWLVSAPLTLVMTNVDGIFPPGSDFSSDTPIKSITAQELLRWGHTSVDKCVPDFVAHRGGRVWVGHGGYPERLLKALSGEPTIGTFIEPM